MPRTFAQISLLAVLSVLATAGCTPPPEPGSGETTPPSAATSAPQMPAPSATPPGPMAGGGPMIGNASPTAPLTKTPTLDKAVADAVKSGDKTKISAAYTARGNFRQNDEAAGARVKYRAALSDFRKALAADPKNADALKYKKNIEDIYNSMGRPVPTDDVP